MLNEDSQTGRSQLNKTARPDNKESSVLMRPWCNSQGKRFFMFCNSTNLEVPEILTRSVMKDHTTFLSFYTK